MTMYRSLLRPLLFKLSADRSHSLAQAAMRWPLPWQVLSAVDGLDVVDPRLKTSFAGVSVSNPVGLAAGFDKNAEFLPSLSTLGFGFICVGSIMPEPRYGNPFPRLVRHSEKESIADSMGVPSKGRAFAVERLGNRSVWPRAGFRQCRRVLGGIHCRRRAGNSAAGRCGRDQSDVPERIEARRDFDEVGMLRGILERIGDRTSSIIVRVPNDTTQLHDRFAELVEVCVEAKVGGLKVGGGRRLPEPELGIRHGYVAWQGHF